MATKGTGMELAKVGARGRELVGRSTEVTVTEYRSYTDEALDCEIVQSCDAAHGHYNGLRRELALRLLPALAEMRRRHGAQGSRNDLNAKFGLPRKAGWGEYLRSRGLVPDTVRGWFQRYAAARTLGHLVSSTEAPSRTPTTKIVKNPPQLYKVATRSRTFIVSATSASEALAVAGRVVGDSISENPRVKVTELGAVIEVSTSGGFEQVQPIMLPTAVLPRPAHEEERDRADLDAAIVTTLKKNPGLNHRVLAERFKVTTVTVRRIATRYKLNINPSVGMVSKSASVNADN
jgi:hypothetical protein